MSFRKTHNRPLHIVINKEKPTIKEDEKYCHRCKTVKNKSDFHKNSSSKDGLNSLCKPCNSKYCREKSYKRLYGINKQDYQSMYDSQNGNCSICNKHFDILCVDHDHHTGKVRSLLCNKCNYNLGVYKESKIIFQRFIDYIDLHTS